MELDWEWETDFVIPQIGMRTFNAGRHPRLSYYTEAGMIVGDMVSRKDGSRERRGIVVTTDRAIQEGRKIGVGK